MNELYPVVNVIVLVPPQGFAPANTQTKSPEVGVKEPTDNDMDEPLVTVAVFVGEVLTVFETEESHSAQITITLVSPLKLIVMVSDPVAIVLPM